MSKLLSLNTAEKLTTALLDSHSLPDSVIVLDVNTGELDNHKHWANLTIVDAHEYATLKTVELEERAEKFKLKLALSDNDRAEDLTKYVGKQLKVAELTDLQIIMSTDKFSNFTGFVLKCNI